MPRIMSLAGGAIGAAALAVVITAPAAYAADSAKGSAFGVRTDLKVGEQSINKTLAAVESGDKHTVLNGKEIADATDGRVKANAIQTSSREKDGGVTSRAHVAALELDLTDASEAADAGTMKISASSVSARCTSGPGKEKADSHLSKVMLENAAGDKELLIKGNQIQPNEVVEVDGLGRIVFNEQDRRDGKIVVNAIHIYVAPEVQEAEGVKGDIIISQAVCEGAKQDGDNPDGDDPNPQPSDDNDSETPSEDEGEESTGGSGGGEGADSLPVTGFKLASFAGIGAALIAAGIGLVWFMRRRAAGAES